MAEAFSNSLARAAGIVTTYSGSTIGAAGTTITVTANTGIGVSDLIEINTLLLEQELLRLMAQRSMQIATQQTEQVQLVRLLDS